METILLGDTADFSILYKDSSGDGYDPPEVTFSIVRTVTTPAAGPYTYTLGEVVRVSAGKYVYHMDIPFRMTPGVYAAKWTADLPVDATYTVGTPATGYSPLIGGGSSGPIGTLDFVLQKFQVSEPHETSGGILDPPRTYGVMKEYPGYRDLGVGLTDRIFLIGHGNGLTINEPHQVADMRETINLLGADEASPLVRGLLEVYNAGGKDIWLVAAADMLEYVPELNARETPSGQWGGLNFYEQYASRLADTYSILEEYQEPEIIVPLEAPFYDAGGVDFLTPLVEHCAESFGLVSTPRIGIIGTRIEEFGEADVTAMAEDARLDTITGTKGKFVMIVGGEATFNLPQMPNPHSSSVAASVAGAMSILSINQSVTYKRLTQASALNGRELKKAEIKELVQARVNMAIKNIKAKRGTAYNVVVSSDNSLSQFDSIAQGADEDDGSDFWSITQMRVVSKVINEIRTLGSLHLGSIAYVQFKREVDDFLKTLVVNDFIRGYTLVIERDENDFYKANVEVVIQPYFSIREIFFQVQVGPGA